MGFISNIFTKHNYNYFDQYNQLQVKQLNIFQCILRKCFGCYQETHLQNVVKLGYAETLKGYVQFSTTKREQLLKVIYKAQKIYEKSSWNFLGETTLPGTRTLAKISIRYNVNEKSKISSVAFVVDIPNWDIVGRSFVERYEVTFFKNREGRMVVSLPFDLFGAKAEDTRESISKQFQQEKPYLITQLVSRVLKRSRTNPSLAEVSYYAPHYGFLTGANRDRVPPSEQNRLQKAGMESMGWQYLNFYADRTKPIIVDGRNIYTLDHSSAEDLNIRLPQDLSLDFADPSLETHPKEH